MEKFAFFVLAVTVYIAFYLILKDE